MHTTICPKCCQCVSLESLEEVSSFAVCKCGGLFEPDGISIYDGHPRTRTPIPAPSFFQVGSSMTAKKAAERSGYRAAPCKEPELALSWPLDHEHMTRWLHLLVSAFLWLYCALCVQLAIDSHEKALLAAQRHRGGVTDGAFGFFVMAACLGIGGAIFTYRSAVAFGNRSQLTIRQGTLRVHHGPLPFFRDTSVDVADIDKIFRPVR